jgi:hypothetical protein
MLTVSVAEWIGKAAAVLSGVWGAVTRRSKHSGSSRTTLSVHAQRVVEAVANAPATGVSYEALGAANERLRAEHAALWQVWSETETRSEAKPRAFAAAGTAMGLSLTQIVVVLPIVVPWVASPVEPRWGAGCGTAKGNRIGFWTCSIGLASVWCWWCVWTKSSCIAIPY